MSALLRIGLPMITENLVGQWQVVPKANINPNFWIKCKALQKAQGFGWQKGKICLNVKVSPRPKSLKEVFEGRALKEGL